MMHPVRRQNESRKLRPNRRPIIRAAVAETLEPRRLLSGTLDTTFNSTGIVNTNFGFTLDTAMDVAVQSDGKIVAVGSASTGSSFGGDFAVARYNPDGTLDTTFNFNGKVTTDFGDRDAAEAVVIQPDGKIVVGGWTGNDTYFDYNFALVRYNPDGTVDTAFGAAGKVTTDFGVNGDDELHDLLLQPDGKFVAIGRADGPFTGLGVARYNPDGSPDTTFNSTGRFSSTNSSTGIGIGYVGALVAGGKILVGGEGASGSLITLGLMQLNANGTRDTSFGTGGVMNDPVGTTAAAGLAVSPSGTIYVAATIQTSPASTKLFSYSPTGVKNTSFGAGGSVTISSGGFFATPIGVAVQSDGKVVLAATSNDSGASYGSWTLARVTPAGALDSSFGSGGKTVTGAGSDAESHALAIQSDGNIIVAGYMYGDFVLARYIGDHPVVTGTISGTRFSDNNANGVRDAAEPGLSGTQVYLDLNNNGSPDGLSAYASTDVNKFLPDNTTTSSTLTIAGFSGNIGDLNLTLSINHTWDSDLTVSLRSPGGTTVQLWSALGTDKDNFTNTTLDDEAVNPLSSASAPFTGAFRPQNPLTPFDGVSPNGTWTLLVNDNATGDAGTLVSWSLAVTGTTAEPAATTDATGFYSFAGLAAGTYTVRDVALPNYIPTAPTVGSAGSYTVNFPAGGTAANNDFGDFPTLYVGTSSNDTFTFRLDPATFSRVEILVAGVVTYSAPKTFAASLSFNLAAGDDLITVDYTNGNPVPAGGITIDGGPHNSTTDRLVVTGSALADTITLNNPDVATGSGSIAIKGIEATTVNGNAGNDSLTLGVALFSTVTFNGGANTDSLTYNASEGNDTIFLDPTSILSGGFGASWSAIETLNVNARFGFDTVAVNLNSSSPTTVTVNLGDGNDTCTVNGSLSSIFLNVNGDNDNDALVISPIATAKVTYNGGNGTDSLTYNSNSINDLFTVSGTSVTDTFTTVSWSFLEAITLNGNGGADVFSVNTTLTNCPVTLNGGDGNDTFNIGSGSLDSLPGAITVNGNNDSDSIFVNDSTFAYTDTYTLTSTALNRIFFSLTYATAESFQLRAQTGANTFTVSSLSPATAVTFIGTGGGDTLNLNANPTAPFEFRAGSGNSTLNINAGATYAFNADAQLTSTSLTVNVATGASAAINATQHLNALNLNGGSATLAPGGTITLVTTALTASGGKLNLNDNAAIVNYSSTSPISTVRNYLASGRSAAGNWSGATGITSTSASNDPNQSHAIGYLEASDFLAGAATGTWSGQPIDPTSLLLKYTVYGDANLDSTITPDDFALTDRGMAMSRNTWVFGDFNYSATIDAADYLLLDKSFVLQSGGGPAPTFFASRSAQFGQAYVADLLASLPPLTSSITGLPTSPVSHKTPLTLTALPSHTTITAIFTWSVYLNGRLVTTLAGDTLSFTPKSPGEYTFTLLTTDPAANTSTSVTASLLVTAGPVKGK